MSPINMEEVVRPRHSINHRHKFRGERANWISNKKVRLIAAELGGD
jgi:hypothetical protein